MQYWLTAHYPPYREHDREKVAAGIWAPDGRETAGADITPGDRVFIYESRSGRTEIEKLANGTTRKHLCHNGREGVVAVAKVIEPLSAHDDWAPTEYTDGTKIWWRWFAELKIESQSGFIPRRDMLQILGYSPKYNLHGFGDMHSGLKKLSASVGEILTDTFRSSSIHDLPVVTPRMFGHFTEGGGESDEHRLLKEFVANDPSGVLNEHGLVLEKIEYSFQTGDRADIVLRDQYGRIVGVEIEVTVGKNDYAGPLQAIKYRRMLEMVAKMKHNNGRAMLVAYSIDPSMKNLCSKYEIECHEIKHGDVKNWTRERDN